MSAARMHPQADNRVAMRARRRRRVLRPWRWALLIYGLVLTTATHWPRLELSPEIPASDKTIHLAAFGILTLLLWRSGWISSRWMVGVAALGWAALDEASQGIPALQRSVSIYDMIANACGVVCAMAIIWMMRPIHNREQNAGPSHVRARLFAFTFDEMFARPLPWLIAGATALLCALALFIARPLLPTPQAVGMLGVILAIVAAHVLYLTYRRIFFMRLAHIQQLRPCLACGEDAAGSAADECSACGEPRQSADYTTGPQPAFGTIAAASIVPALIALVGIAALFTLVLALPHVYGWVITTPSGRTSAPRIAQIFGRMPRELTTAVDLTVYTLLIAVVVRVWRRQYVSITDRAVRCRRCGHDLHGTPVDEQGRGRCGECGTTFTRDMNTATAERDDPPRETAGDRA